MNFTEQDYQDAEWAVNLGIQIRQEARLFERKSKLTDEEVLSRVAGSDKERYVRGKALNHAGAFRENK